MAKLRKGSKETEERGGGQMGGSIAVVFKEEGGNRKETRWFNHAHDAERHIEGLLEAGFNRQSIRVLEGRDMDVLITQKPVVSLLPAASASMPTQKRADDLGQASDPAPVAAGMGTEPYTQDGVRFSSLFSRESLGPKLKPVPAKP